MKTILMIVMTALLPVLAQGAKPMVSVGALTTEMAENPLGVEAEGPRLGWKIYSDANDVRQKGYRILVASSPELLAADKGDLWDSGNVKSDASLYVPYGGRKLVPMERCWWKVKVNTNRGSSPWSEPALWQTGLPDEAAWEAEWIGGELPGDNGAVAVPARYLRKSFDAGHSPVKHASLYIAGLGLYEAFLNGRRIGDGVLLQAPTEYFQSVRYDVHDVTPLLKSGMNTLGVTLGNGRHTPERMHTMRWFGFPRLLSRLEIEYADGTRRSVVSDGSWRMTADGPIRANSEFDGEIYDARKELYGWNANGFDDTSWIQAPVTVGPGGKLQYQLNQPIRVMDYVMPQSVMETRRGVYVLDMGQNMVGWLRMKLRGGERGDSVTVRFAETLNPDSTLYVANLRSAKPQDIYIFKGVGEESWQPAFTYHGFRYAEISGLDYAPSANEFMGMVIYDGVPSTGSLSTGNDVINRVYGNAFRGIRGNYRGMPTDCPQRDERLPWLGDRSTNLYGEAYMFGNNLFYDKWLDDIRSCQKNNGGFPDIAPNYWDCFSDNMTWPVAYFTGADMLYRHYGDIEPIARNYDAMKRWLDHMKRDYMHDYIIERDEHGDWCVPPESPHLIHTKDSTRITDGAVLASSHLYLLSGMLARFARLTGHEADAVELEAEAAKVKDAFNRRFFNETKGCYSNNTVTANLLPLRFGMVPAGREADVFRNIVETTEGKFNGHVSVGVMGIQHLMRGLTENGRLDLALKLASNTDYPSWGYMAENGATTIWELWNGNTADPAMNSGNHVMLLGDLLMWEYGYLAGIDNADGSVGFKRIRLHPRFNAELGHVDGSYESVHGKIASRWAIDGDRLTWDFSIPCNTTAEVYVPAPDGGRPGSDKAIRKTGGRYLRHDSGCAVYEFPSGTYSLQTAWADK